MNASNCLICVEKINQSTRAKIECEYCDFVACRSCFEIYLLSQSTPHCMKSNIECGKIWTRKFIANNFTLNFATKKYKFHQEQVLFERELSLMPETQLIVERQIQKEKKIEKYTNEIDEMTHLIDELMYNRVRLEELRQNIVLDVNVNDEEDEDGNDDEDGQETKNQDKNDKGAKLISKCSNENCRGFLSSRWKCNLCETWTCRECNINIGTTENKLTHVCNDDDLQTAKLLKKDSKSCPKCGIIIFKISGCDQMYCTQCHTPFSWKTGRIETGTIHNPHYYEYLRMSGENVPRNPLDIVGGRCDMNLNNGFTLRLSRLLRYMSCSNILNENSIQLLEICNNINHLFHVEIASIRQNIDSHDNVKQNNRIKYLKNLTTEEEFKKIIQMNDKKYQKFQELINLYVMVRDTTTDIIHAFYDNLNAIDYVLRMNHNFAINNLDKDTKSHVTSHRSNERDINLILDGKRAIRQELIKNNISDERVLGEIENLQIYANDCLKNISKTYNSVYKQFDEAFKLITKVKEAKSKKEAVIEVKVINLVEIELEPDKLNI
jgi:hypothetical protein